MGHCSEGGHTFTHPSVGSSMTDHPLRTMMIPPDLAQNTHNKQSHLRQTGTCNAPFEQKWHEPEPKWPVQGRGQGRAGPGRAGQGRAGPGRAGQGRARAVQPCKGGYSAVQGGRRAARRCGAVRGSAGRFVVLGGEVGCFVVRSRLLFVG